MSAPDAPAGYRQSAIGGTLLVARDEHHVAVRTALGTGTLYGWAATQPGARAMQGRGVAWATRLPNGPDVVVRHSRHGGMLATLTGDLFLAPTRAPRELNNAVRLQAAGVPTPVVVAYAVYGAFGPLCRADVVTSLLPGDDLPAALTKYRGPADRRAIADAVQRLNSAMWNAGAHHPDLNARNILISRRDGAFDAWVIDVDRVSFHAPRDRDTAERNVGRLAHSLQKLLAAGQIDMTEPDLLLMSRFDTGAAPITPPR